MISIKVEGMSEVEAFLSGVQRQIPFATSKALNEVAKKIQQAEKDQLRKVFTIRNQWIDRSPIAVKVKFSKKTDLVAEIFSKARFLSRHEEGAPKIPFGRFLAVPTSNVVRTGSGRIQKKDMPAQLKRSFVIQSGDQHILFSRFGREHRRTMKFKRGSHRKTGGIEAMYMLEPRAKTAPVLKWYLIGENVVKMTWASEFDKALNAAIRSAK